jgi:hypothetical protein
MEPITLTLAAVALALYFLLRQARWFSPALLCADGSPGRPGDLPDDEEEQQPETDRAPRRHWLGWSVASVAVVRLAVLLALHA